MSDTGDPQETEEELLKRHRQERKELQAKIQSLKKTAPKGKKKKDISDIIAQLEQEIDEKHHKELIAIQLTKGINNVEEPEVVQNLDEEEAEQEESQDNTRVSRAQRRRNKKANDDKERDKRILEQEVKNRKGPRVIELNAIKELLKTEGLQLFNIPADGNCLYCAVNHQLKTTDRENYNVTKLRELTANFMREHKDDFLPFMCNDSDEPFTDQQFEEYCKDVATSKFWGGQMELKALSHVLQCPIKVIQASGPLTIQGDNFNSPPLIVTYHRHLYRLGEHYNSTVAGTAEVDDEQSS